MRNLATNYLLRNSKAGARVAQTIYRLMLLVSLMPLTVQATDLVVVVHQSSVIDSLSKDQIKMLYLGKNRKLNDDIVANIIDQPVKAPIREEFYLKTTNKTTAKSVRIWARYMFSGKGNPPKIVSGDAEVIAAISADPSSAIGYIRRENLSDAVKVVFDLPID
jgi:ABC-type phosphate transport system substrate-binding protein